MSERETVAPLVDFSVVGVQKGGTQALRTYGFLGVRADDVPPAAEVHVGEYEAMPRLLDAALRLWFHRDIRRLEKRLGWDLSDWRLF